MTSASASVLIESDWNLKQGTFNIYSNVAMVLIESDWNLKSDKDYVKNYATTVLIESDWNLKEDFSKLSLREANGINRIRLEFKVGSPFQFRR